MKWLTEKLLPQLNADFTRIEDQFNFISEIDQKTLSSHIANLDENFKYLCGKLVSLLKADGYSLAHFSEKKCINVLPGPNSRDKPEIIHELQSRYDSLIQGLPLWVSAHSCLIMPVVITFDFHPLKAPQTELFNAILIYLSKEADTSIHDKHSDLIELAKSVCHQMSIFVQRLLDQHKLLSQNAIIKTFFNHNLEQAECWKQVIKHILSFLPNLSQLRLTPEPKVQLLSYEEGDKYLTIIASQGREPAFTKVLVSDSICGMLINDRSKSCIQVDPNDDNYKGLYKGFLIHEGDKRARSELAIPLKIGGKIIGVLNLEHVKKDVFNDCHTNILLEATQYLAPFISALKERYESNRRKEIRLVYVLSNLLNRMGRTYSHDLGHPITKAFLALEEITKHIPQDHPNTPKVLQIITKLSSYLDDISLSSDRFTQNLPEFMSFGPHSIVGIVESAISLCDPTSKLKRNDNIQISVAYDTDYQVFASKLLREHIYNLLDNAVFSVRSDIAGENKKCGFITIAISREPVMTNLDESTPTVFIKIVIEDSGGGITPDKYKHLGTPGFTTKKALGSGYGLAAAMDYIESIDGDFRIENEYQRRFAVILRIHEFNPDVHKSTFAQEANRWDRRRKDVPS